MMKKKIIYILSIATVAILSAFTLSESEPKKVDAEGKAYAVTWKNDAGWWFAVGPVQATSAGEKTEDKALDHVRGYDSKKKGHLKHVYTCGKYRVYDLGVDYNSYDMDAIAWVRKKGYNCTFP